MAKGMSREKSSAWPEDSIALPNKPAHASDLRAFVGGFLDDARVPEEVADEVMMAVGEVVANACRHGRAEKFPGVVEICCELRNGHLSISVRDDGPGFDARSIQSSRPPHLLSQGGRGFFLMEQLMDRVQVDSDARGTTVTLERQVPL